MGIGDEIMASGRARVLHEKTRRRVVIVGRSGIPRWSDMWTGVPFIAKARTDDTVDLMDGPGARPYYEKAQGRLRYVLTHRPIPGTIALPPTIPDLLPRGYVLLEPHVKGTNSANNKLWPWDRWVELTARLVDDGIPVAQAQFQDRPMLERVVQFPGTESFRQVAAYIAAAEVVVASEGGYHHAAAAANTPAVVLWGGLTTPEFLGYEGQRNIFHDDPESPCGRYRNCDHCRRCMERITVDEVFEAIMEERDKCTIT